MVCIKNHICDFFCYNGIGDDMKKRYIIIGLIALVIILTMGTIIYYSFDPDDNFDALICQKVTNSKNNGNIYCYYLYKNNNKYKYIETKQKIKNNKNGSIRRVKSGSIKNKDSFNKLVKNIKKNEKKNYTSIVSSTYKENGTNMYYDGTDILEILLFE